MRSRDASTIEKAFAMLAGAAEGFADEVRRTGLAETVGTATGKLVETGRGIREAIRAPHEGPPGPGMEPGAPPPLPPGPIGAAPPVPPGLERVAPREPVGPAAPLERVEPLEPLERAAPREPGGAREAASRGVQRAEAAAAGLGQAAERAARAPALLAYDAREMARAVAAEARHAIAGVGVAILLGVFALGLLTLAVVAWLNAALGDHYGTLIVAAIYALGAALAYARAKRGLAGVRRESRAGAAGLRSTARVEARGIMEPVRRGMRGERPGGEIAR